MAAKRGPEGPVALTEGNKLYLYQLLVDSLGAGRQTFLPKAAEVLAQVQITPAALGRKDDLEVFEALSDFCTITAFKGGRFYVTVVRKPEWDAALEKAKAKPEKAQKAGKPWKRKKGQIKPQRPKLIQPAPEPEAAPKDKATSETGAEPETYPVASPSEAPSSAPDANQAPKAPDAVEGSASAAMGQQAQADDAVPAATSPEPAQAATQEQGDHARPAKSGHPSLLEQIEAQARELRGYDETPASAQDAQAPSPAPQANETTQTTSTGVIDASPMASPRPDAVTTTRAGQPTPPAPEARPAPQAPAGLSNASDLPRSFADEVSIKPALLGMLTRMLPIDADVLSVLDEDLRVARATGSATGSRSRVTFPLRYLQEDGSAAVSVTIKRATKTVDSRRWQLVLVDGDDGTGNAHEAVGIEGLPQAEGGYWTQLAPKTAAERAHDPVRDLAQFMELGTWEQALGALCAASSPERWNYPGEGVGLPSRYGVLREYLAATLAHVRAQGKLRVSADGTLAAFNTGLVTPMDEDIHAVLRATGTDIPWHLEGFATAGSGELGARMTAQLGEAPERATYLAGIDDVMPRAGALVIPDYRALLGQGIGRLPQGFFAQQLEGTPAAELVGGLSASLSPSERPSALRDLSRAITSQPALFRRICRAIDDAIDLSMRAARQSYRHVAPAYDAARDKMLLLAPLALVDDAHADCALVLELMPSGAYQAACATTLSRAYAAARVVSREMPAWLSAEQALA